MNAHKHTTLIKHCDFPLSQNRIWINNIWLLTCVQESIRLIGKWMCENLRLCEIAIEGFAKNLKLFSRASTIVQLCSAKVNTIAFSVSKVSTFIYLNINPDLK